MCLKKIKPPEKFLKKNRVIEKLKKKPLEILKLEFKNKANKNKSAYK